MNSSESLDRVVLQPESEVEQRLLDELMDTIREADEGTYLGESPLAFYTLDVPNYEGLDEDLWREATEKQDTMFCAADSVEPGARALVIHHDAELVDGVVSHGDD